MDYETAKTFRGKRIVAALQDDLMMTLPGAGPYWLRGKLTRLYRETGKAQVSFHDGGVLVVTLDRLLDPEALPWQPTAAPH